MNTYMISEHKKCHIHLPKHNKLAFKTPHSQNWAEIAIEVIPWSLPQPCQHVRGLAGPPGSHSSWRCFAARWTVVPPARAAVAGTSGVGLPALVPTQVSISPPTEAPPADGHTSSEPANQGSPCTLSGCQAGTRKSQRPGQPFLQ